MIGQISSTYQHARRYKQIIDVLVKYGFGYIVEKIGISLPRGILQRDVPSKSSDLSTPQRVVLMLEELGPTFVKFGQILSTRPDMIPPPYIEELKKLQDDVAGISFEQVRDQVETELISSLEALFESFDPEPLAAASLSQVHKAVLMNGQRVVVKVQRPQIDKVINLDLEILLGIMRLVEKHIPESRVYEPVAKFEEFADAMRKELDFTQESWNIEKFQRNFEGDEVIYVPRIYEEFTTKKVITMEYIEAAKVSELCSEQGIIREEAAKNVAKAMMKQIFVHGFFHGDPHPGNILVRPDGRIVFIDFGLMGRIDVITKHKLAEFIIGVMNQDSERVSRAILDISHVDHHLDEAKFEMDVEDLVERYYDKTLKQINIASLLNEVFALVARYRIVLPSNFTLLLKSLITVEGVGRELDPNFNVFEVAKPFVKKLLREYYGPRQFVRGSVDKIEELGEAMALAPGIVEGIYHKLKADSVKIDFETSGVERVIFELNKMVNRLVFGMIVAAIIIGSSLVLQANRGPFVLDFPVLGILGFTVAGVLGIVIIVSILRSGKV